MDRGRNRLSTLSDQPALQTRMFDVVGEVHEKLSDYETADFLLHRSVQLQRAQPTPNRERLGEYLSERASVQWKLGRYTAADSLARRALAAFSQEVSVRRRHEPSVELSQALLAQASRLAPD